MAESDRQLAGAALADDGDAFTMLFEAYRGDVYRTTLAVLGSHEAALDAVQETFFKVHRGLPRWRGESSLRTWITRIAVRTAIDLRRKSGSRREIGEASTEPSHDPRPGIENSLRLARLRALADRLTGQSGIILRLRLFAGLSNKEIALQLDLSEANVRMHLTNAIRRLKEML